jgi:hypothetical protein
MKLDVYAYRVSAAAPVFTRKAHLSKQLAAVLSEKTGMAVEEIHDCLNRGCRIYTKHHIYLKEGNSI